MEPITYANGSTLEDPAITYGIVFSNFMSKGVFTFPGRHRSADRADARRNCCGNGVDVAHPLRRRADPWSNAAASPACACNGRAIATRAVVSNANLLDTIFDLVGPEHFDRDFVEQAAAVRLNNSSTQVYMALQPGDDARRIDAATCCSVPTAPAFRTDLLLSRDITSRTYSFYYPRTRPQTEPRA